MTIYVKDFTFTKNSEEYKEIEIEGKVITKVRIRFPPGPSGLLKIRILYGDRQIFPYNEGEYFYGDDEIIEWDEYWELPEKKIRLRIHGINEDTAYDHSIILYLVVQEEEETLEHRIAKSFISLFRRMFGMIEI